MLPSSIIKDPLASKLFVLTLGHSMNISDTLITNDKYLKYKYINI